MALRIQDFYSVSKAITVAEVEAALQKRYGGVNSFWLTHDERTNPAISVLVRNDQASLHYFPNASHPGFASMGTLEGLPPQGTTVFFMDRPDQEQEVLNSSVVPFFKAVEVANEFLFSEEMPRAIKWFEL